MILVVIVCPPRADSGSTHEAGFASSARTACRHAERAALAPSTRKVARAHVPATPVPSTLAPRTCGRYASSFSLLRSRLCSRYARTLFARARVLLRLILFARARDPATPGPLCSRPCSSYA